MKNCFIFTLSNYNFPIIYLFSFEWFSYVTIVKRWKKPKHLSRDDWINKMWNIHRVE